MSIKRIFTAALVLLLATAGQAQVEVIVHDESGKGISGVHVIYAGTDGKDPGGAFTDGQGKAQLPQAFTAGRSSWVIRMSCIGYVAQTDTVQAGAIPVFKLQKSDVALGEVVVTAQYAPGDPEKAVHKVKVIGAQKIDQMAAVNLQDVLLNETNIRISQDNVLGTQISMMGISGGNVKVMIDGVPVIGRQDGNIDLNQINLLDVERIEVVEGPLSVNYGSNALAGTINIITKKDRPEGASVAVTSYNTSIGNYNLTERASYRFKDITVSASGGRNFFDGWNPTDDQLAVPDFSDRLADSSRVQQWNPREQLFGRAQVNYSLNKLRLGYKVERFYELITNRGLPRAPYNEDAFDDYYRTDRTDHSISADGELFPGANLSFVAAYNDFKRTKNTYAKDLTTLNEVLAQTEGAQDTSSFALWMSRGSLAFANDSSLFNLQVGYDFNYETAGGRRIDDQEQEIGDYALFATMEFAPLGKDLILRPGLRYSYNTVYDSPLLPSFNVRYGWKDVAVRASWARGFRAPSLKELYFFFVDINHNIVGNADLKAENSDNYSASLSYRRLWKNTLLQFEGTGFYNDMQNLITLAQVSDVQFSYVNIGEFKTQGVSLSTKATRDNWQAQVGGSYIGRWNALSEESNTEPYTYYPEITFNGRYEIPFVKLQAQAFYKYQGRLPGFAIDGEGAVVESFVESYHLLDANLSRAFWKKRIRLAVGAKNLTNVTNVQAGFSNSGAHSSNTGSVPVSTGRMYFVKLDYSWSN